MFGLVMPAKGELTFVVPGFEEARARELIRFSKDVRVWQEDEPPESSSRKCQDRGIASGKIGIEERTRFFLYDGIRKAAPALEYVSADPVTAGCRMIKSAAEIALLQKATTSRSARSRSRSANCAKNVAARSRRRYVRAYRSLGAADGGALVGLGRYSAFPHGSIEPQKLREGDIVLIDSGCHVEGYESDITRTTVSANRPRGKSSSGFGTESAIPPRSPLHKSARRVNL